MSVSPESSASHWRDLTVAIELPAVAFGAAVDVEDLLSEPDLHFATGAPTSRLVLMPRLGTFSRLVLEWETLPEIGVFSATSWPADTFTPAEIARLETWMRDVASVCHGHRERVRATAERAVRDASSGLDQSEPDALAAGDAAGHELSNHVVSAHVGTRAAGPTPGAQYPIVDVTGPSGAPSDPPVRELRFVDRATGTVLGRRLAARDDAESAFEPLVDGVTTDDLADWYEQHIVREVLFDDVWQVCVHLLAGLEAPADVVYFS